MFYMAKMDRTVENFEKFGEKLCLSKCVSQALQDKTCPAST